MADFASWGRILLAIAVYFLFALLTLVAIKRLGGNLKQMEGRAAGVVPMIGTVANVLILACVVALFLLFDREPLAVMGLAFGFREAAAVAGSAALTSALAVGFLPLAARASHGNLQRQQLFALPGSRARLLLTVALLLAVSLQEEFLFRGYLIANLRTVGPLWLIVVSTVIFTFVHFPTNRLSAAQISSWTVGGLLLVSSYLISGSLWVAVGVHFVTDFSNVIFFNVAGQGSIFILRPPLSTRMRTIFRVGQGIVTVALLLVLYGVRFELLSP